MNRLNELDKAPVGQLLWKYSVPSVVGIMVMSIYNVIDRIFIGQGVGADAIAGLAITFPVMNISSAFGVLVGVGASTRISVVLGMGNKDLAKRILGNSIVLTLVLGTFYIAAMGIFLDPILRLFGASDTSLPYAHDFMLYLLPGLLMNNICYSYNNVMRATGYPNKAMWTMFIGAGLNVILAPIFIFALGWGIKGAAIATDISMGISAMFVMMHFFNPKSEIHFTPGTYRVRRDIVAPILSIGAAPCIVNSAGCIVNAIINNTIFRYGGDSAVAAMGIFITFTQLIITFIIGVCMGMQPIVGYNFGARQYQRLKRAFWLTAAVCSAASLVGSLLGQLAPSLIARPFTSDPHLIAVTDNALRLTTIMFWCAGFQIVCTNLFQAVGDVPKSIFMSLSRQVLFLIPCLLILPEFMQLSGVWLSFPLADALSFIVSIILLMQAFRKINALAHRQSHSQE